MTMRHSIPIGLTMSLGVAGIAHGQSPAVQWRVEDGGNGHWYSAVSVPAGITWEDARERAASRGGRLACLETAEEASFCFDRFSRDNVPAAWTSQGSSFIFGPWIGGYQLPGGQEPNGGWLWVSGSEFDPTSPACCNNSCGGSSNENRLHLYHSGGTTWNDLPSVVTCGNQIRGFVIEWSEDCNGDALVDYGQILDGTFVDVDSNGIPDTCECLADLTRDGVVNGGDLSIVLGFWGTPAKTLPAADLNRDGIVDAADLAAILGSWGSCP
jgi:hypothetical protein